MPCRKSQKNQNSVTILQTASIHTQHRQKKKYLEQDLMRKLKMYWQKVSLDLELVCLLHKLAEGI
jgi:hypothetical protein